MIAVEAADVVAAARACLGTPFHHQGRCQGVGLDCIGLVIIAYRTAGAVVDDKIDYGRRPDGKTLCESLRGYGGVIVSARQAGDVLVFRYDGQPQHVALATDAERMIHAFAPAGKVVETSVGGYWLRRLVAVYRFI